MNSEQLNFICNNVRGLQGGDKRVKVFEYLKNHINSNGFVFYKKHIRLSLMKKYGLTIFKDIYSFLMVKQILVVWQ